VLLSALNDNRSATVIMDENMQPLAVYNENAASPREHQAAPPATRHFFTREELLRQQREQEQLHASEYQALLQQHQQEKQQLGAMQRSGKFSADSEARLKRVHQSELLELHEKQQREQAEMIDLIFQDAAVASTEKGKGGKISADEQVKYQPAVGISDGATAQSVAAGADALTMRTTSISAFIQKLNANDPSLTTIILDGRKSVTTNEWTMLFDSLEENTYLTHLSVADCGLDDDTALPLALALVENETLISLNLSYNRELTNETGNSLLKVLRQSNLVMKQLMVDGTNISFEVSVKIQGILDDRDETKILEKMQAVRQQKIEELLAFSASDALSKSSERLSQKILEADSTGTQGGKKLGRRK
jgi:hypothetical protein